MKILTYNVMLFGRDSKTSTEYTRLPKMLDIIRDESPDVVGFQETDLATENNRLFNAIRSGAAGEYKHEAVMQGSYGAWTHNTGVGLFSKSEPVNSRVIGDRVRAVEMSFPASKGELVTICNVYLSHVSEAARLPEMIEVLEELGGKEKVILMGDFNALSPQDGLSNEIIAGFTPKMVNKYTKDGKICYDVVEAVLETGFFDVGLHLGNSPGSMTDMTDLNASKRKHNQPMRMDYIFASPDLHEHITSFSRIDQGKARIASDHFPWQVTLDDKLLKK